MDNIPEYLRIGIPTIRRQKTVDEVHCEMKDKISVLEKDNRELIEIKVKRETELFQLKERLESLEKLYNEIREEKASVASSAIRPSPVINEDGSQTEDKKKPSQYGDLEEQKKRLEKVSKTLERIKQRTSRLTLPKKVEE
jgi:predicted nuclease with TOPRIM domain